MPAPHRLAAPRRGQRASTALILFAVLWSLLPGQVALAMPRQPDLQAAELEAADPPPASQTWRFNFQADAAPTPLGYTKDIGQAFDAARGYGWITEASVGTGTSVPLALNVGTGTALNVRDRQLNPDQRLDTLIHMEAPATSTMVKEPGAWELIVPNGTYSVTVAVGDPSNGGDPETHTINVEGVNAVNAHPKTADANGTDARHKVGTAIATVADGRLTIDAIGGTNTKLNYVDIVAGQPEQTGRFNFQAIGARTPATYTADTGLGFDATRGFGWIRADSIGATPVPIDVSVNTRNRTVDTGTGFPTTTSPADQRLDTLVHLQAPASSTMVKDEVAWELAVPTGWYSVTVAVGDAPAGVDPENHRINVEGVNAIAGFAPSGAAGALTRHTSASVTVGVTDGRLTIDPLGGTNTKLHYVELVKEAGTPPPPPPPPNQPPVITNPGSRTDAVGTAISALQLVADDPDDSGALTFAANPLPNGLALDADTGLITGTPTTVGPTEVVISASDGTETSATETFTWTIDPAPANAAPVVTNPGAQESVVNVEIAPLTIEASDSEDDPITFEATGLPAGLSLDASTGAITGTPTAVASDEVTITASDGVATSAPITFTWAVVEAGTENQPPVLTDPGDQSGTVGVQISPLTLAATDPDDDSLTYAATDLPPGLAIEPGSNQVSGIPTQAGTFVVAAEVTDGTDTDSASFSWVIDPAPAPACQPWSTLPCTALRIDRPFDLGFSVDAGGIEDKNGYGTGFTLVQPSTNGEYLPANLTVEAGQLKILTTNGIQFRSGTLTTNANSLDNGLGVAFDAASTPTRIETTVVNPPGTTNNSQQGGVWFGLNEDNYIKLVAVSTGTNTVKVQALREQNGGVLASDLLEYNSVTTLGASQAYQLALVLDPASNTITATATANGTPLTLSNASGAMTPFTVPASWLRTTDATGVPAALTSAGIFATHRAGPAPLTYAFDQFAITEVDTVAPDAPIDLAATPGDARVDLAWSDSTASDLAGYRVYRGTTAPVTTIGTPLSGTSLLTSPAYADTTAVNGTIYHYAVVAVDGAGNASSPATATAMPDVADPIATALPLKVNFQIQAFVPPAGFVADYGQSFANVRGFGWVVPGTDDPRSLVGNGRDRARAGIAPELNTLIHMQGDDIPAFSGVPLEGAWELAVADGSYTVTVSVGDQPGANDVYDSTHSINVEGTPAIETFQGSTAQEFEQATVAVDVSDGRLTIDAIGGTNTKPNYVTVASVGAVNQPPLLAQPGAQVSAEGELVDLQLDASDDTDSTLSWSATGLPAGITLDPATGAITGAADPGTAVGSPYLVSVTVEDSGELTDTKMFSWTVEPEPPALDLKFNFQQDANPVPAGYTKEIGAAFDAARGYGWVTQATAGTASPTPLNLTTNTRDRNRAGIDQLLDTLIHMQYGDIVPQGTNGILTPGAWELVVPNGTYQVTVSVGDQPGGATATCPAPCYDSMHTVRVEGVEAIDSFVATAADEYEQATVSVAVSDGRLTVDAIGGTNTKLNYIEVQGGEAGEDTTPPSAPASLVATPGDGQVHLAWAPNAEPDLAGYNVYRSTALPVDITGTPLNGSAPQTTTSFLDAGLTNGTTYHYVVQAVDDSGNQATSAPISGTPQAAGASVDVKINFQSGGAAVPLDHLRDFGEPFGPRSGANQGTGQAYGWVIPGTDTPRDLSIGGTTPGNGRDRNLNSDQRLDTLMHIQADDVSGTFNGTALEGAWEIAVPNGVYAVTVAVGDPAANDLTQDPEFHTINVEGNTLISRFVPSGAAGANTRHTVATALVTVADGRLTADAINGQNTKINYIEISSDTEAAMRPSVTGTNPANGATNVPLDAFVAVDVRLPTPGNGVDAATLTSTTVRLFPTAGGPDVAANRNTTGGRDAIVLQPTALLQPSTQYTFVVTDGVKDETGAAFIPYQMSFTTSVNNPGGGGGADATFEKVPLPTARGENFTTVTIGPDGKLYASTIAGEVWRWVINSDGTLQEPEVISSLQAANGGPRMLIGITFDPSSTADNLILWASHSHFGFSGMPDWGGRITRLSGPNLATVQDYVINLPRSCRDHLTNSIAFGPDGAMYVNQGSNSAMGAADNAWCNRPERQLSGAVLRVNLGAITSPPLDVKTEEGGTYDAMVPGAPVSVFGSGVRNAYDLVWHSNGSLYVPTNGSAAGGNTPGNTPGTPATLPASCQKRVDDATNGDYTGPEVPGITGVNQTQPDFLFRVVQGGSYGHPNPQRCEWVLNGGNPTGGSDPAQVTPYPVGVAPDRNWRAFAFDFANNKSPNGVIEYKSNTFDGALRGKILVARFSGGDDIMVLTPGVGGDIVDSQVAIPGFTGFRDPLDLTEDTRTGNIYVTEYDQSGSGQQITLVRPVGGGSAGGPDIAINSDQLLFNEVIGGTASPSKSIVVRNTGTEPLTVSGISLSGAGAAAYTITGQPTLPATIAAGGSTPVSVAFDPDVAGPTFASLVIASNDPDTASATVELRGLGTNGLGGANEPSLQWVLDTHGIPVDVGDDNPATNVLHATQATSALLGDEVSIQHFVRAVDGPVGVEPLAVFGPTDPDGTVVRFGWYPSGDEDGVQPLFSVPNVSFQSIQPSVTGSLEFDPGTTMFGFASTWPFFDDRVVLSEDGLNTWESNLDARHKVRVYEARTAAGAVIPDTYIVATEEHTSGFDYQDVVVLVTNVKPAPGSSPALETAPAELVFSGVKGTTSQPQTVTFTNDALTSVEITGATITGTHASSFTLTDAPSLPLTLGPTESMTFDVTFTPSSTTVGSLSAALALTTIADYTPAGLHGLATNGLEGGNEPPLKQVVDTLGYPIDVGGTGLILGTGSTPIGDEIVAPLFVRAGAGEVGITPVARYSPSEALPFGYYVLENAAPTHSVVATIQANQHQTLHPAISSGTDSFNPGAQPFGVFVDSLSFGRKSYTQDGLNTGPTQHAARVYPLVDRTASPLPNTYMVAFEDAANGDYQDYVFVLTNVAPFAPGGGNAVNINFQPSSFTPPPGYTPDTGEPFSATRGFGWVVPGTATPVDMTLSTRLRTAPSDPLLQTLILVQGNGGPTQPNVGSWEYTLPNGTYEVTVTVGDASFTDSVHRVVAEGTVLVDGFVPTTGDPFDTGTGSVTVQDGRLTIAATGGTNTKLTHLQIAGSDTGSPDITDPTASIGLVGSLAADGSYKNSVEVTINAADDGGSGLAGVAYQVNGGAFTPYSDPFEIDIAGDYSIVARAIDGSGNAVTTLPTNFKVIYAEPSLARIDVDNLDVAPFEDRLVFNRIQNPEDGTTVPANVVHDVSTARITNTGTEPLTITGLSATPVTEFALVNPTSLPAVIQPGAFLDVPVRFTATIGDIRTGTLTIESDDPTRPTYEVELAGFWQSVSEGNQEPTVVEILRTFGYGTTVLGPGQSLNTLGALVAQGDEILSPYWQRANTTQPVTVRQLAAFHTQGNSATFFWTPKNQYNGTAVLTHVGVDGQSFYPRKSAAGNPAGVSTFTPAPTVFGFRIDPEHSDWAVNTAQGSAQVDEDQGCVAPCGHHFRTWPARDRSGAIIPNTYVMTMDYAGINYDFNDNLYIVSNIRPESAALDPAAPAPLAGAPALSLEFSAAVAGTLGDQAGQGTGFTSTQPNRLDLAPGSDSYAPELLDLDPTGTGTLTVTTTAGSNANNDNTLTNGLRRAFDASTGMFTVQTTLTGPLSALNAGSRQGGVMFGADQDNYVKVVAINRAGVPSIELFSELSGVGATIGATPAIPSPATVQTLDLMLIGDASAGTVRAAYRVNGGAITSVGNPVVIPASQLGRFFAHQAMGGIITMHKTATEFPVTFDRFSVTAGDVTISDAREALYRLDVAGNTDYTDEDGNVWTPDDGHFLPASAVDEGASTLPLEIANTDDDPIYRTYRGNVGSVPMAQRALSYELPLRGLQDVDLRLHFAERAAGNGSVGARLFDIEVDGVVVKDDFDIFAAAGATNTAITLDLPHVAVPDGVLSLSFRPSADYASIAGIEVLCEAACPAPDGEAPDVPEGLTASTSTAGINLGWDDVDAVDLAGYRVYRAAAADGPWSQVNTTLVTVSGYTDTTAPAGEEAFYRVTAEDLSGNESAPSSVVSATMPDIIPGTTTVRINAGGPSQTVGGVAWSACSAVTACGGWVTGGFAFTQSPLPTITGATPPTNQTIHQSEWTGGQAGPAGTIVPVGSTAFTFDVPVTNGAYLVRLHFTELNKNGTGLRTFDVNLEGGAKELVNFDVFTQAGGMLKAIHRDFNLNITDGDVTIDFVRQVENAKISAIEILPAQPADGQEPAAPSGVAATADGADVDLDWAANGEPDLAGYHVYRGATSAGPFVALTTQLLTVPAYRDESAPADATSYYRITAVDTSGNESNPSTVVLATTQTPPAPTVITRLNAGGPAVTTGGVTWVADQYFTGGKSYTNPSVSSIAGTTDDVLYLTERSATASLGSFSYAIPVPASATYTVRLHMAEIYWGATGGGAGGTGHRIFSVNLEGGAVELANYDLNADVAPMTAVVKSFDIAVTDGTLNLAFTASLDQPKVSAIEVLSAQPPTPNAAPVLGSIADPVVGEGSSVAVAMGATDADGDPVTFGKTGLPAFASIVDVGPGLAQLQLAPGFADAGSYPVIVSVSDGRGGSDAQPVTITVTNVNRPPILSDPGDQSDAEGDEVNLAAQTADPDGDALTYTVEGLPDGLSLNAATGAVTGTLAAGSAAESPYAVTLTVSDGRGGSDAATFSWSVGTAPDPTPPPAPTALAASVSSIGVNLSWTASTEPNATYLVYRAIGGGTYTQVNAVPITAVTFTDTTAPIGEDLQYRVTAVDTDAMESSPSDSVPARRLIGLRAASAAQSAGSSLSINRPAGTQSGDVLIATLSVRGVPSITPPGGWTLVRMDSSGATMRQATYFRIAGSEAGPYTWTFSTQTGAAGSVVGYVGVDATSPIDVNAGSVNPNSASVPAPSVTATVGNGLLVTLTGIATNATFTPGTGMVEHADVAMNSGSNKVASAVADDILEGSGATGMRTATASKAAVSIGHALVLRPAGSPPLVDNEDPSIPAGLEATAASSGQIDLTWAASSDNVAVVMYRVYRGTTLVGEPATTAFTDLGLTANTQYTYTVVAVDAAGNESEPSAPDSATTSATPAPAGVQFVGASSAANGGAATLTIPRPSGVASGHLLVASIDVAGASAPTTPAGWTLIGSTTSSGGTLTKATYWRVAPPGQLSFAWSFGTARAASGAMVAYSGADVIDPIGAAAAQSGPRSTSITAPSVAMAGSGTLIGFFGTRSNGSITPPSGMTERAEVIGSGRVKVASEVADLLVTLAGASGERTATASKAAVGIGQTVFIRAAGTTALNGTITPV